ncbi:MAG: hypothetical protein PF570_00570 [Candidatus Cloacimonetes bacterium]|jgi:hypothetical protein|nr:hypothetical protein [Candidatus Cloacimonadota bacterium]
MKIKMILILFVLSLTLLTAQNVLIWDRDDGSEISDPEDPWNYVGLEAGLKSALSANGVTAEIDSLLADDLSQFDIIFATAGIWCGG